MTLSQAARHLPTHPHPSTLWRWCRKGVNGEHLEYARLGSTIVTSLEAIDRFSTRLKEIDDAPAPAPAKKPRARSERSRKAGIARAYRELEEAGVLQPGEYPRNHG